MVLVAVGDDDRLDLLRPFEQVGEVGEDEVDAHHLRGREAKADVDDDDAVVVLDDRHVLPDLAQAPEGEDAQRPAHACARAAVVDRRPWRSSVARTAARSFSEASTSGRRRPPTSWPRRFRAAFVQVGLDVRKSVS